MRVFVVGLSYRGFEDVHSSFLLLQVVVHRGLVLGQIRALPITSP